MQVYTARTSDDILESSWFLGVKQVGVISISDIQDPAFEVISALAICYKLVKGVVARDKKEDFKIVEKSFKLAASSKPVNNNYRGTEIIDGYEFEVQMEAMTSNLYSYICSIKEK